MKTKIQTILVLFACLFGLDLSAQTISFYFSNEMHELNKQQEDSLRKVLENKKVLSVVAYANQLQNAATKRTNTELAKLRAESTLKITGPASYVNHFTIASGQATDRRVDITYTEIIKEKELIVKTDTVFIERERNIRNELYASGQLVNLNQAMELSKSANSNTQVNKPVKNTNAKPKFCDCRSKTGEELENYAKDMLKKSKDKKIDIVDQEAAKLCYKQVKRWQKEVKAHKSKFKKGRSLRGRGLAKMGLVEWMNMTLGLCIK